MAPTKDRKSPESSIKVYGISPSSAIEQPRQLNAAITNMKRLGFDVRLDRAVRARSQRFAGDDQTRIAAFNRAARSKQPVVMITRGGYGLTRLLSRLDFNALADAGKHWVGLSDFTAFHLAMLARCGAGTWAGPAILADFSGPFDEIDPTTSASLIDALTDRTQAVGFACDGPAGIDEKGVFWGGNLEVLSSMLGTDYFPQVKGGILFLEEVGEHPYRIERKLTQLLNAGVIDEQKAVVFGYVNRYKLVGNDRGFDWPAVVKWLRGRTRTPIICGLPFGHDKPKLTLPHGATLNLVTDRTDAYLVFPDRQG